MKAKQVAEGREMARRILADPDATEQEREWARTVISVEENLL